MVYKEREREGGEWRVLNFEYILFLLCSTLLILAIEREDFAPSSSLSVCLCVSRTKLSARVLSLSLSFCARACFLSYIFVVVVVVVVVVFEIFR